MPFLSPHISVAFYITFTWFFFKFFPVLSGLVMCQNFVKSRLLIEKLFFFSRSRKGEKKKKKRESDGRDGEARAVQKDSSPPAPLVDSDLVQEKGGRKRREGSRKKK